MKYDRSASKQEIEEQLLDMAEAREEREREMKKLNDEIEKDMELIWGDYALYDLGFTLPEIDYKGPFLPFSYSIHVI